MYNQMDPYVNNGNQGAIQQDNVNPKTNTLAIVGFILSFFLGFIGSILCIVALCQIMKKGEKGKGFAIAGIIIGIVPFVLVLIFGLVFAFFIWPDVQANLLGETACANVDYMGNYESVGLTSNEEGYVKCNNFECLIHFNENDYEFSCNNLMEE